MGHWKNHLSLMTSLSSTQSDRHRCVLPVLQSARLTATHHSDRRCLLCFGPHAKNLSCQVMLRVVPDGDQDSDDILIAMDISTWRFWAHNQSFCLS